LFNPKEAFPLRTDPDSPWSGASNLNGEFAPALLTHGVLVVLNTNDSGAGSLRQAIDDAISGDIIHFDGSVNGQTLLLKSVRTS